MDDKYIKSLKLSPLFKSKDEEGINKIFSQINYKINTFKIGEKIFSQGDTANYMGVVMRGKVKVKKRISPETVIQLAIFEEGETFGEAVMFKENKYPATVTAAKDCNSNDDGSDDSVNSDNDSVTVMLLPKEDLEKLMEIDEQFAANFLKILNGRLKLFNEKINSDHITN
ncbi:Crp/Fnr family transcriptional regulator [Natranaerofaba carboxydovora]|uniref:Crp/Fnr family transcriptional regulator n=1 Tax=Natranaerofaba carboxydovora TaxID=2742683 RepID=UPI001F129B2C|nr:cyclic nucleotide-binding domain-containing protein [Natranaerofaba carboxydovora]UMZ72756.1 Cyclic nucleotide-binding domain protein [Natranaerofaba carboxydovora]